jgi:NADP-dependent 3-hydroxy acid dehydrogenase YdfG
VTPRRRDLRGAVAVVTGASSGIGRAVAVALADEGARLVLVGRRRDALEETARLAGGEATLEAVDLADDEAVASLAARTLGDAGRVDVLVHGAGEIRLGEVRTAPVEDLERQLRVNLRAPYVLTQALLPALVEAHGQVVFVNSSAGRAAGAGSGAYAASKHGLRALADALRAEVNEHVRVLSVFPGNTASPMQRRLHEEKGREYRPERLLQPEDVAAAIVSALILPATAEVTDLHLRPMLP